MMEWKEFINKHEGESCIICGCGPSIQTFIPPENTTLIGVNDVGKWITPDYLVCVNDPITFKGERFLDIKNTQAQYVFSHIDLPINEKERLVKIPLGKYFGRDLDSEKIDFGKDSPYLAIHMAYRMGFRSIGIVGVDFSTGHSLEKHLASIKEEYAKLERALNDRGITTYNLSFNSPIEFGTKKEHQINDAPNQSIYLIPISITNAKE